MGIFVGTSSPFDISFRDKGGEVGNFGVSGLLQTEDDFAAQNTLAATFVAKLDAAVLGQIIKWNYGGIQTVVNPTGKASSASAQRENKLLVRYHDVTTLEPLTASIPSIDLPSLIFETDAMDFVSKTSPTAILELVAAWQAFVVNPRTNNLTTVDSLEFVGRNS